MSADFVAALAAVRTYARTQGQDADDHVTDDGFDTLMYAWTLNDALAAVREATAVVAAGSTVTLRLPVDALVTVLHSDAPGTWLAEDRDPSDVLPHLGGAGPKAAWSDTDLTGRDAASGFAAVTGGTVEVAFPKAGWRSALEQEVDRTVWIGPGMDGLASWVRDTVPEQIAAKLFTRPGALVLLEKWPLPPVGGAARLAIGDLDLRPPGTADDDVLVNRLANRGESALLPRWRLLDVDTQPVPLALREPLQRAIGLTAVGLLAEVAEAGHVRPSATEATEWAVPATPGEADGDFAAVIALVRWIGQDLSEARLEVARNLAATRIDDPAEDQASDAILRAARLAFRLHIKQDVRESLEHQQKLEEAFRDLDDRVAEMRAKLANALDGALTKAIAGALTITIASLTSAKVRDWPATIAGVVLAGYLILSAVNICHLCRDSKTRLDEAAALARTRVEGLGDRLTNSLEPWKTSLTDRARFALGVLIVVAVAVLVGAVAQNAKITGRDDAKPQSTTKTQP